MEWTKEQQEAIDYRSENILVAAAAGSGKTAVLVERIIQKITDTKNLVGIDEILVLTFTDAAAAEMRHKIADAVRAELAKEPSDEHLRRQNLLMGSAMISTIHSFCMSVIRSNIHHTQLPAAFSIVSEAENEILLTQALDIVLEKFYANIEKDSSFRQLALGYGGTKNDSALRDMTLNLYRFSESMARPAEWLNSAVRQYRRAGETDDLSDNKFAEFLFDETKKSLEDILQLYGLMIEYVENELPSDHKMHGFFEPEREQFLPVQTAAEQKDYAGVRAALQGLHFATFPSARGKSATAEVVASQKKIKALRDLAKELAVDLQDKFSIAYQDAVERMRMTYPQLRTFKNILLMVRRLHTKMKREKNYLDFSDLEHETVRLLSDSRGNPTDVARALSEKYEEILVDEYQDTNHVQDTIFRLISREGKNVFMVGDIKQCIYKFRHAVPDLFLEKYSRYGEADGGGHLIRLFKNFRSRENVVNTVNDVFHKIMSRRVGDVDYTTEEYLVRGADYYPRLEDESGFATELLLTDTAVDEKKSLTAAEGFVYEARNIARRIRQMTDGAEVMVTDKQTGKPRAAELRDIVILVRQTKGVSSVLEEALQREGIPSYSAAGQAYLSTQEVLTALSFLQITENPRQDIPLLAVLRSPVFGFTAGELADIRANRKHCTFYEALQAYAPQNEKAANFLNILESFRDAAPHTTVDALLWRFYRELGYEHIVGTMDNPIVRQANLRLLYERAAEFERGNPQGGVTRFLAYIDAMRSRKKDMTAARVLGENDNVVRIMTMHKSKGLEFPIVFVAGLSKKFNSEDAKKNILWNSELGFGLNCVDTERRVKYPSLPMHTLKMKIDQDLRSEEMRLFYVALTRAKEKLVLSAAVDTGKKGWKSAAFTPDGMPIRAFNHGVTRMRDWLLPALAAHPAAEFLREYVAVSARQEQPFPLKIEITPWSDLEEVEVPSVPEQETVSAAENTPMPDDLISRLEYQYPYRSYGDIPVKLSVSEIKQRQMPEGEHVPLLNALVDKTLKKTEEVTGTERGVITHFVLQHLVDEETETAEQIQRQLEQMVDSGMISRTQQDAVSAESLFQFYQSDIGRRMKAAKRQKEYKFYMEIPARDIFPSAENCDDEQNILLQGVVDCFFEEEDGLVVLDYKTDCVSAEYAEKAAQRYQEQLKYYAAGLSKIFHKPVKKKYIYFLHCGKTVEL
uniref:DNA 3'-5' helicase n=1 Tax=uncultured Bacillota bacterium TaxID=344338 RepID=A0A650EMR8_9FIRM|nr:ATP-dependent helicase/nuclease subunit A [uncultured Firmicutes bacterium]